MKQILLSSLLSLVLYGCGTSRSYNNKTHYQVKVGEEVLIYYSTNSCCYFCLQNQLELNNVSLIERRSIEKSPEDCAGCNATGAFVFKAESIGVDTIKVKLVQASMDCDSNLIEPERYIIEVIGL